MSYEQGGVVGSRGVKYGQQRDFWSEGDIRRWNRDSSRDRRVRWLGRWVPRNVRRWWQRLAWWSAAHELWGLVAVLVGVSWSSASLFADQSRMMWLGVGAVCVGAGMWVCGPALWVARRTGRSAWDGWMAETGLTLGWAWCGTVLFLWRLLNSGGLGDAGEAVARAIPVVVALAGAAITAGLVGLSVQRLPEQSAETTTNDVRLAAAIRQRVQFAVAAGAGVGCLVLAGTVAALPPDSVIKGQVGPVMMYLAAATALSLLRVVGEFLSGVVGTR